MSPLFLRMILTGIICSNVNSSASGSDVKKSHTIFIPFRSHEPVVFIKLSYFDQHVGFLPKLTSPFSGYEVTTL